MPIKSISDIRRIRRGGHIRIGEMVETQSKRDPSRTVQYPRAIDHFRPDFENEEHEALFHRLYGDEPKRIKVAFGHDDPEKIFPQWYKLYGRSGLKCRGDGEVAGRWDEGNLVEVECLTPDDCPFAMEHGQNGKPGCKRMASLQFFIHGIPELCVFQLNTTSYNSIVNVNTGLELLARLTSGHIAGIWVDLVLQPQEVQAEGKAKTVHVLDIVIPVGLHNIKALECAFNTPLSLPEPSEAHDPYLNPEHGFAPPAEQPAPVSRRAEPVEEPSQAAPAGVHSKDPDVQRAIEESGLADAIVVPLLNCARDNRWPKERLLQTIADKSGLLGNGGTNGKPANGTNGGGKSGKATNGRTTGAAPVSTPASTPHETRERYTPKDVHQTTGAGVWAKPTPAKPKPGGAKPGGATAPAAATVTEALADADDEFGMEDF
jgi:hypothetical protein